MTTNNADGDFERAFVGNRQINITHFFCVNRTEDTESPVKFAFGYWTHDGIYRQGFVGYSSYLGTFGSEQIQEYLIKL